MGWLRPVLFVVAFVFAMSCATDFPMEPGFDLIFEPSRGRLDAGSDESNATLQITWLGTGCYQIQLGDGAILTDPFVSHQGLLYSGVGGTLRSDEQKVKNIFGPLAVPRAMFVAHGHWDHLMDVAPALKLDGWEDVPVYGSPTVRNILAGYDGCLDRNWRHAETETDWIEIPSKNSKTKIEYMAFEAKHAPQAFGVLLYGDEVKKPRQKPPTKAWHFQMGRPYAYLFRFSRGEQTFTVYVLTSASEWDFGAPPESEMPVDVAILCVPGWDGADRYPKEILGRLRARHVVLAHFDDFFQSGNGPPETVTNADFDGFARVVQAASDYAGLERIVAPNVGSTLRIEAR